MEPIRIVEVYQEIETKHQNPYTGERYSTWKKGKLRGYEVTGGWFCRTFHKTIKSAEAEEKIRTSVNVKFPWVPPQSEREIAKCKRMGL